ncbi:EI24 domain-containing protein [Sideroxydans lithotrophicus]|uniref:Transmembrane protein n=1 Tax=Sideroxydans lithotrophicus (strain ES-1) TaxID=580332 RepID=D5CR85_SIDLE|nr:EI24 domain-containing protein [Sideroxydans lithotrophicus]ADE11471.1 transmembrane protein [Sideroxydans lithotrophicus ES-1]
MNSVLSALIRALQTLFHPKMLSLVLWPMLVAVALWVGAAMLFWGSWVNDLTGMVQATPLEQWIAHGFLAVVSHYLIVIILMLLLLPAIYVTALLITAVFAMPMMVDHVAEKYYPELERKRGGSNAGSIANAAVAIVVYCAGWVLSLPLWLFSPLALLLPLVLMAYLNQRLFRYDALAEHASREEYARVIERGTVKLYLLGLAAGLLQFVPLLNLFSPVYVALAFIHLCLDELKQLRQTVQDSS